MSQQKSVLIRTGDAFLNLLLFNFGEAVRIVTSVSRLLQDLICCVSRDILPHTMAIMSD